MDMEEFGLVELPVPEKSSGRLYGRGGKKLQRLQETFGVLLEVTSHGSSEIVRISGAREAVAKAESYVSGLCNIGQHVVERKVHFPADMKEYLLGKSGQCHHELEARSGAVVRCFDSEATIHGYKVAVELAALELEKRIKVCKRLRQNGHDLAEYAHQPLAVLSAMFHVEEASAKASVDDSSDSSADSPNGQPDKTLIAYGVELGWGEDDVLAVVRQLGGSPDKNLLLTTLLKRFPNGSRSSPASSPLRTTGEVTFNHPTTSVARTPTTRANSKTLRPIVVDGSNVAMAHSNGKFFSCRGILKCVEYFRERGHTEITCFVPMWRKESSRPESPISDQEILLQLQQENVVVFTPSRRIKGKRVTCYDDRYVVQLADETGGIIVSNDNYRDLQKEKKQWRSVIEERLLMYSFAQDIFMPPEDPLGSSGPSLDEFLRFPDASGSENNPVSYANTVCPFDLSCTFSTKCKYGLHPKRDQHSTIQKSTSHPVVPRIHQRETPDLVAKGLPEARSTVPSLGWDEFTPPPPPPPQQPAAYHNYDHPVYSSMGYQQPPSIPQDYYSRGPGGSSVSYPGYSTQYEMPPPMPSDQYSSPYYSQSTPAAQADMDAFLERHVRRRAQPATYQHPSEMYSSSMVSNMPPPEQQHPVYHNDSYMSHMHPRGYGHDPHDQYMMPSQQWNGYSSMSNGYGAPQHMPAVTGYNAFAEEAVRQFSNNFQESVIREVIHRNPGLNDLDELYSQIIIHLQRRHR